MAGNSSITTENFFRLNFTPKSGITPGTEDTLAMSCDQILARYSITIAGGTSTGLRLPAQNELTAIALSPPVCMQLTFPNGVTSSKLIVESSFTSGKTVTARGLWYNTTGPTPTGTQVVLSNVTGLLTTNLTGLAASTGYYVTAYCTNADGTTNYSFASAVSTMPSSISYTALSSTWACPNRCISVTVECWGGGGSGGPAQGNSGSRGGGGSGGCYAKGVITVTAGSNYTVNAGPATTRNSSTGSDGMVANFINSSLTVLVRAVGGKTPGACLGTSQAGMAASSSGCIGTTIYIGGNGGNGTVGGTSGGGGGGAGSTGAGNNASLGTAGASKSLNGGAGGSGVTVNGGANDGASYGGGGSGGLATGATDQVSGAGAGARVLLTFP